METLLITIVPSILILFFFVFSDRFREPKKIIIITFFLFGILITIPAGYLNDFILDTFETESEVNNALLGGFLLEDLLKKHLNFWFIFYILKRKLLMNQWMQ